MITHEDPPALFPCILAMQFKVKNQVETWELSYPDWLVTRLAGSFGQGVEA